MQKGGRFGNALQAASFVCHELIVKLILNNGAEVNAAILNSNFNPVVQDLFMVAKW
jgi:hypothetical protein